MKKWIILFFNSIYNSIYFWLKRNEAIQNHKITGKMYHVIPSGKKLIVVDNTIINVINKNLPKGKKITIKHILESSYFSTPSEGIIRPSFKQ